MNTFNGDLQNELNKIFNLMERMNRVDNGKGSIPLLMEDLSTNNLTGHDSMNNIDTMNSNGSLTGTQGYTISNSYSLAPQEMGVPKEMYDAIIKEQDKVFKLIQMEIEADMIENGGLPIDAGYIYSTFVKELLDEGVVLPNKEMYPNEYKRFTALSAYAMLFDTINDIMDENMVQPMSEITIPKSKVPKIEFSNFLKGRKLSELAPGWSRREFYKATSGGRVESEIKNTVKLSNGRQIRIVDIAGKQTPTAQTRGLRESPCRKAIESQLEGGSAYDLTGGDLVCERSSASGGKWETPKGKEHLVIIFNKTKRKISFRKMKVLNDQLAFEEVADMKTIETKYNRKWQREAEPIANNGEGGVTKAGNSWSKKVGKTIKMAKTVISVPFKAFIVARFIIASIHLAIIVVFICFYNNPEKIMTMTNKFLSWFGRKDNPDFETPEAKVQADSLARLANTNRTKMIQQTKDTVADQIVEQMVQEGEIAQEDIEKKKDEILQSFYDGSDDYSLEGENKY